MRCPVLVGRSGQVAAITTAMDRARRGRGAWISITGEAGVGKSRLVAEAVGWARARGGRAVVGRCSSVDRTTPYRPLAEGLLSLFSAVDRPDGVPNVDPYVPAVARFLPHWRRPGDDAVSESPAVVGASVVRVLSWAAEDNVLLVVLEDLHWADADTIAVSEYLVDHLEDTPLLVLATARPFGETLAPPPLLARAAMVNLDPLAPDAVVAMAEACLGAPPSAAVVDQLIRLAGGLPLAVEDLLDRAGDAGAPSRFDQLVASRFDGLSTEARLAVVAAALIGERFRLDTVAAALGLPAPVVAARLHEAAVVQLVTGAGSEQAATGDLAFRHALTRESILSTAPVLASSVQAGVSSVLESAGDERSLARAAELSLAAGDGSRAARLWLAAADAAGDTGAPATVSALLERALDAAAGTELELEAGVRRLRHLVVRGAAVDAVRVGLSLVDRGADLVTVRPLLARALLDAGRVDDAESYLAGPGDAEVLVLRARAALQSAAPNRRQAAEHLARQAVATAEAEGRPEVACEGWELVGRCARSRSLDDAASALGQALAVAARLPEPTRRLRLVNELGTIDMLRRADGARLLRARDEALQAGALDVAVGIDVNIASLRCMQNQLAEGAAIAGRAGQAADRLGLRPLVAAAEVLLAISHGLAGRVGAMEPHLRRAEELSPHDADLRAFAWSVGRGFGALVREERPEAVHWLLRARRDDAPIGSLDASQGPLVVALAADGAATAAHLEDARSVATPGAAWSDLWLGLGEAVLGGEMPAFERAEKAGRCHPLFRALGLRLAAEAALRDGWGRPGDWLRDAEAVFVASGLDRPAAACRTLLARIGEPVGRRRGVDRRLPSALLRRGVTAREAEVLELVADRLGNKEIATRLYLSPRTVEKHVASLLAKLDVADRSALISLARSQPEWGPSTHAAGG